MINATEHKMRIDIIAKGAILGSCTVTIDWDTITRKYQVDEIKELMYNNTRVVGRLSFCYGDLNRAADLQSGSYLNSVSMAPGDLGDYSDISDVTLLTSNR